MIDEKHCKGCVDDFYNGHNPLGVQECWMRKDAKLVTRILVHRDLPPPYLKLKPREVPNCFRVKEHSSVNPENLTTKGYWK